MLMNQQAILNLLRKGTTNTSEALKDRKVTTPKPQSSNPSVVQPKPTKVIGNRP